MDTTVSEEDCLELQSEADAINLPLRFAQAGNCQGLAIVLSARARRHLSLHHASEMAIADALRAVALYGGSDEKCNCSLLRTAALALMTTRRYRLAAAYLKMIGSDDNERATGSLRRVIISKIGKEAESRVKAARWRRLYMRETEPLLRMQSTAAVVVVGLGTGRCGTSSLAALLTRCLPGNAVSHEELLPECRLVLWKAADEASAKRRLDYWLSRGSGPVRGDVNYAHLPSARFYLDSEPRLKLVVLRRDKKQTVQSFMKWTTKHASTNINAPGHLADRNHWLWHDDDSLLFDDWDLTFPKYHESFSKSDAISRYYDEYYDYHLAHIFKDYGPRRIKVFPSPEIFQSAQLQAELFAFLGITHLGPKPMLELRLNVS